MIFGPTALGEAEGAVLAHTLRLPGLVLKKGAVLDAAAVARLREAGLAEVVAVRLEASDVGEDQAADRLAQALLSPLVGRSRAGTGRVNLMAEAPGLLLVDRAQVDRLNAVDEALTLATLADATPVAAHDMLATVKVIPFAVHGDSVARAERLAREGGGDAPAGDAAQGRDGAGALRLVPFRPLRVGLVLTLLPGLKDSVVEATIEATEARVRGLTGSLLPPERCAHEAGAVAAALSGLLAAGAELLLVSGASAVVDRRDVGPAGIVAAGGAIQHLGMPVDPGNLICFGRIGDVPALVLPSCARSPKLNGIDQVLWRLFAGLGVDGASVSRMGVGGLLKEDLRPLPRAQAARATAAAQRAAAPRVAAVVLAAGRSSRMAPRNKLLIPDADGHAMVTRVVDQVLGSAARPVLVVVGHQSGEVERALAGRPVRFVHAEDYGDGLSASLRAGIAAVPEDVSAALVCLGDMPLVTARTLDRLVAAYDPDEGRTIVVPTHRGRRGNPVLWDARWFAEIAAVVGDTGARALLAAQAEHAVEVEIGEDGVLRDFDTPEALAGWTG
ncbi:MAG: NTP transferase domain-containing protein [Janthinobacterium lividum]